MLNVEATIISQYANSPILRRLIKDMNECIDPSANIDAFYDYVWNVDTAQGFGLDVLGRIVGVSRIIKIPSTDLYFGFQDGGSNDWQPFNQAPFYDRSQGGLTPPGSVILADDAYRTLIMVKALSNISDCSARSINTLLRNLFTGRGRCYVLDNGGMMMTYVFEFYLYPFEVGILTDSNALLHPAGVGVNIQIVAPTVYFGFEESDVAPPFGFGVFYTG